MKNDDPETDANKKIVFHYKKGKYFRTIFVDGAYGGITPRGYISASIYSERRTIPKTTEAEISEVGVLSPEIVVTSKQDVFRELEANLTFDLNSAVSLHKWLGDKIAEMQLIRSMVDEKKRDS